MPDITMCRNENCDKKEACYRYNSEPKEYYQSFAMFDPKNYYCFMEMKNETK